MSESTTPQKAFQEVMTRFDSGAPEWWHEALPAWSNAFLELCERGALVKARLIQLNASRDLDTMRTGIVELMKLGFELDNLMAAGERLDAHYLEVREWLLQVEAADRQSSGAVKKC